MWPRCARLRRKSSEVTDKMPSNYDFAGLIHLASPTRLSSTWARRRSSPYRPADLGGELRQRTDELGRSCLLRDFVVCANGVEQPAARIIPDRHDYRR